MFKFNRVVCAVLVCTFVVAAYGAAVKIRDINPVGLGTTDHPDCDGMAILNFQEGPGKTEVQVAITDFAAGTTYGVRYENGAGSGSSLSNAITTNPSGNGTWHDSFPTGDVSSNPTVIIFIDDNEDFDYTPGEERACGGSNCPCGAAGC